MEAPPAYDDLMASKGSTQEAPPTYTHLDDPVPRRRTSFSASPSGNHCSCGNMAKSTCVGNECRVCCASKLIGSCRAHDRMCRSCESYTCTCGVVTRSSYAPPSSSVARTVSSLESQSSEGINANGQCCLPFLRSPDPGWDEGNYHMNCYIFGLPLFGFGLNPCAFFAIGAFPRGFLCLGWVTFGYFLAIGQAACGLGFVGGQLAAGLFTVGQLAFGLIVAIGQLAFGLFVGGMVPIGPFDAFALLADGEVQISPLFRSDEDDTSY